MATDEGHQCYIGSCINWVQFDDEDMCFAHTPPRMSECTCSGCKPPPTDAQLKREIDILFGVIRR